MNTTNDETQQKSVYKDTQTQQLLNTPLSDPKGVGDKNQQFLELVMKLISEGKINLYNPSSLINRSFYDTLTEQQKGKADYEAMNLLSTIRDIKGLYDAGYKDTYQMESLVDRVRNMKERSEEKGGDMFII